MASVKTARAKIKATSADTGEGGEGLEPGQFRALVAVFGNVDSYGDRILPGAFTDTLKAWADSGDPIPVVWSHRWDDPFAHVGAVLTAEETDDGLEVVGTLDIEHNPTAAQVFSLMKARRITQFSFAFDVEDGGFVTYDADTGQPAADGKADRTVEVYELRRLALHEVGPCLLGVNQETQLLDVKALVRREVATALAHTTPGASTPGPATTSQTSAPRDGDPASTPGAPNPPRLDPASVRAFLTTTELLEGA